MDYTSRSFVVADYVVFAFMLVISTVIGVYYAIKDRRKQNTEEYLLAGRSMNPLPVAFSLSVSFLSAVTVLGTPAEVYVYGTMYTWTFVGYFIAAVVAAEIFIPVYFKCELSSVYQYLEKRFHWVVRLLATVIYLIQTVLYTGIVIYAPALALNAVTGVDLWGAAASTALICILYSTVGGLKAVIWTDAIQMGVMLIGFISVLIQTSIVSGGYATLWRRAEEGRRIEFWNFDTDPRIRHTVWSVSVGSTFLNLALYAVNQSQVQRYLSCSSVKGAKTAVMVNFVGIFLLNSLALLCGVAMYGHYYNCDPLKLESSEVTRADQLMPYLVLELFHHYPGMPGLFVAAVFSGSLSTVSTAITALASVTVQDFLKPNFDWNENTYTWVSKALVLCFGLLCLLFAYLTSQLGALLQAVISVLSLAGAPLVVVFTLGVIFPFANTWGAISGMVAAAFGTVWLFCGKIAYPVPQSFSNLLPTNIDGCLDTSTNVANSTTIHYLAKNSTATDYIYANSLSMMTSEPTSPDYELTTDFSRPPVADLYAISYIYMTAFGFIIGLVVGLIVSLVTGGWKTRKNVDKKLLHPFFNHWLCCCFPNRDKWEYYCGIKIHRKRNQSNMKLTEIHLEDYSSE